MKNLSAQTPLPLSELLSRLNVQKYNFKTGLYSLILVHTSSLKGMKSSFSKGRGDNSCTPVDVLCIDSKGGLCCGVLKRDCPDGDPYLRRNEDAPIPTSLIAGQMTAKSGWLVVRGIGEEYIEDYITAAYRMR